MRPLATSARVTVEYLRTWGKVIPNDNRAAGIIPMAKERSWGPDWFYLGLIKLNGSADFAKGRVMRLAYVERFQEADLSAARRQGWAELGREIRAASRGSKGSRGIRGSISAQQTLQRQSAEGCPQRQQWQPAEAAEAPYT